MYKFVRYIMEERSNEFTIKDLIGIVVPKFWIVAIISILVSAVVGVCSSFFDKDESYSTTVQFYVHFGATEANSIDIAKARQLRNGRKTERWCYKIHPYQKTMNKLLLQPKPKSK